MAGSRLSTNSDRWQPARLFPTVGVTGQVREEHTTSILLAVMRIAPGFARSLLSVFGRVPVAQPAVFTEVSFTSDHQRLRVDGLIELQRGDRQWTCLVQTKTGLNDSNPIQIGDTIRAAKQFSRGPRSLAAVLSISHEATVQTGEYPRHVNRLSSRSPVELRHRSWADVYTTAVGALSNDEIIDADQRLVMKEFIDFLTDRSSGVFPWPSIRMEWSALDRQLQDSESLHGVQKMTPLALNWFEIVDYAASDLTAGLLRRVVPYFGRTPTVARAISTLLNGISADGVARSEVRVEDVPLPINISLSIPEKTITCGVRVEAPRTSHAKARVRWLMSQLSGAPDTTSLEAKFENRRGTTTSSLKSLRTDPYRLLLPEDPTVRPVSFDITMSKRFTSWKAVSTPGIVGSVGAQLCRFYRDVVQDLRVWNRPVPRYPDSSDGS